MFNTIDDLVRHIRKELEFEREHYTVLSMPEFIGEAQDIHKIVIQTPTQQLVQIVDMNSIRQMYDQKAYGRYFVMSILKKFKEGEAE